MSYYFDLQSMVERINSANTPQNASQSEKINGKLQFSKLREIRNKSDIFKQSIQCHLHTNAITIGKNLNTSLDGFNITQMIEPNATNA